MSLRAAWFVAPLGVDEGGIALVAQAWSTAGDSLYGPYWLDRPPLLLVAYRLALLVGDPGVRVLGALSACALTVVVTVIARVSAGERAARIAAAIAALLSSSAALQAVFTPAELVAAVPSAVSVLAVLTAARRPRRAWTLMAAAGFTAASALLVKQSAGDALVAGSVFLVLAALRPGHTSFRSSWAVAYVGGAIVVVAGMEAWMLAAGVGHDTVWQAMIGFRLDGMTALAGSDVSLPARAIHLVLPSLGSGLILVLAWALVGARALPLREPASWLLIAWLGAAAVGVAGGGSYWPHYLIELIAPATVLAAMAFARGGRTTRFGLVGFVTVALAGALFAPMIERPDDLQRSTVRAARWVRERSASGDSVYVLYARANLVHDSGLRSPYPYHWSLMVRALPGAEGRLRRLLGSPQRPTWIVEWQRPDAFGLDRDGSTRALLRRDYRRAATIDGHPVLIRRDDPRTPRDRRLHPEQ